MKKVFVVHGWGGTPKEGWFPWLKDSLEKKHFKVIILKMPNTEKPEIKSWVSYLKKLVGKLDENTFFIGHSVGCQTILRYLEKENKKCAGIIFVAPWVELDEDAIKKESKGSLKIYKSWQKEIDFERIRKLKIKLVSIFSDNDYFVPLNNVRIFEKELLSDIVIMHNKGHFTGSDNIKKLPVVVKELLSIKNNLSK